MAGSATAGARSSTRAAWVAVPWSARRAASAMARRRRGRRGRPGGGGAGDRGRGEEVAAAIRAEKPKVVFAPHVETASGILLPDDYLRTVSAAAHEVGALFVLDCVASGAMWVDME